MLTPVPDTGFYSAKPERFNIAPRGCPAVEVVARQFVSNANRVGNFFDLMASIAGLAPIYTASAKQAVKEITGKDEILRDELVEPQINAKIQAKIHEITDKQFERINNDEGYKDFENARWIKNLDCIVAWHDTEDMKQAARGLLQSAIISSWTTIEVMLGDLWEAALNACPMGLATMMESRRDKVRKNDWDNRPAGQPEGKWISHDDLLKYQFNVSQVMGTILREDFKFTILAGATAAYTKAFLKDNENVLSYIQHPSLKALSAMRNVIVHKNGMADQDFLDAASACEPLKQWKDLSPNSAVELSGHDAKSLIDEALLTGAALISGVDEWILTHLEAGI
jgi:hypothetical protein